MTGLFGSDKDLDGAMGPTPYHSRPTVLEPIDGVGRYRGFRVRPVRHRGPEVSSYGVEKG